jgi:hypothetical protein
MNFFRIKMDRLQGGVGEASSLCFFPSGQSEDASLTSLSRRPIFIATLRGRLAVFPRFSLDAYDSDMGASFAP